MTIETMLETTDPIQAFLLGAQQNVADKARAFQANMCQQTHDEYVEAIRTLRRYEIDFFGVQCPDCSGYGDHEIGWTDATFFSPSEPVFSICRTCGGQGEVLPREAVKFYEKHGLSRALTGRCRGDGQMKTQINGKDAPWTTEIKEKWLAVMKLPDAPKKNPWHSNYFTPRPYVDEYNRGSNAEGFTYTIDRDVYQVVINNEGAAT